MKNLLPTSVCKQSNSSPGDNQYYPDVGLLADDSLHVLTMVWFRFQSFGESDCTTVRHHLLGPQESISKTESIPEQVELRCTFYLEREQFTKSALSGMFKRHKTFTNISKLLRVTI